MEEGGRIEEQFFQEDIFISYLQQKVNVTEYVPETELSGKAHDPL